MSLIPFQFDTTQVRVVEIDGAPWFVARDVTTLLGYANGKSAIDDNCRGVARSYPIVDALNRTQEARVISEGDVLRLVVRSKLPAAERFERWVFDEVVPAIRKNGRYALEHAIPQTYADALQLAADMARQNTALIAQVTEQAPKVAGFHRIADCEGLHTLTNAAKALQLKPRAFCQWLGDRGWIFRQGGKWLAYQTHIDRGELVHKLYTPPVSALDEPTRTFEQVLVTDKGMARLAEMLDSNPKRSVAAQVAIAQISEALK